MVVGAEALELGVEATSELLCLHTISASRLGELESARVSAAALGSEADCTGSALVEYGCCGSGKVTKPGSDASDPPWIA